MKHQLHNRMKMKLTKTELIVETIMTLALLIGEIQCCLRICFVFWPKKKKFYGTKVICKTNWQTFFIFILQL